MKKTRNQLRCSTSSQQFNMPMMKCAENLSRNRNKNVMK